MPWVLFSSANGLSLHAEQAGSPFRRGYGSKPHFLPHIELCFVTPAVNGVSRGGNPVQATKLSGNSIHIDHPAGLDAGISQGAAASRQAAIESGEQLAENLLWRRGRAHGVDLYDALGFASEQRFYAAQSGIDHQIEGSPVEVPRQHYDKLHLDAGHPDASGNAEHLP